MALVSKTDRHEEFARSFRFVGDLSAQAFEDSLMGCVLANSNLPAIRVAEKTKTTTKMIVYNTPTELMNEIVHAYSKRLGSKVRMAKISDDQTMVSYDSPPQIIPNQLREEPNTAMMAFFFAFVTWPFQLVFILLAKLILALQTRKYTRWALHVIQFVLAIYITYFAISVMYVALIWGWSLMAIGNHWINSTLNAISDQPAWILQSSIVKNMQILTAQLIR